MVLFRQGEKIVWEISIRAAGSSFQSIRSLSSSRFQQEPSLPISSISLRIWVTVLSRIHFSKPIAVRERERVHAKFLTLHSPLFLRSGSRRWRYHYSVAVISVACGGTTLAREIKTSGFYVAWDDGSWPVYWSWPPLRAGTRRGALSLLARVARSSSRLGSAPLLVATLRNKRSKIELIECQSSYSGLFVLFVFVLINLFYSRLYCYMSRRLSFLFRICFY